MILTRKGRSDTLTRERSCRPDLRKVGLNESWYRFLHTYLASVVGANIRKRTAARLRG